MDFAPQYQARSNHYNNNYDNNYNNNEGKQTFEIVENKIDKTDEKDNVNNETIEEMKGNKDVTNDYDYKNGNYYNYDNDGNDNYYNDNNNENNGYWDGFWGPDHSLSVPYSKNKIQTYTKKKNYYRNKK